MIGGAIAAGVLGLAAWFLSDDGEGKTNARRNPGDRDLTRDEIIRILKEMNKEFSAAFITLAGFALSIKEQTNGKIKESDLKEILISQSPLLEQIRKAEAKVYEKYNTNERAVKTACNTTFANDVQIQNMKLNMKMTMDKAF
jgi:hypothetical protein